MSGPILRGVDGTKPDPLDAVQRMLDDGIAHMEKRGRKLSKELRELFDASEVPVGAVAATEILNALAHHRQVYANFKMELAILYPAELSSRVSGSHDDN